MYDLTWIDIEGIREELKTINETLLYQRELIDELFQKIKRLEEKT